MHVFFLEKHDEIREKVINSIKNINSEPVRNKKYSKNKIKSYKRKSNTKEGSQYIYISVI